MFRGFSILLPIFLFSLIELGIRQCSPEITNQAAKLRILTRQTEKRKHSVIKEPDPDLIWKLKPGCRLFENESLNSYGFRGPDFSKSKLPNTFRIAMLGDSRTFGFGIEKQDRTFAAKLSRFLNKQRTGVHYEVLNLGVIGYSSYQGRILSTTFVRHLSPDLLIVWYGFNDMLYFHLTDREASHRTRWLSQVEKRLNKSHFFLYIKKFRADIRSMKNRKIQIGQRIVRRVPPDEFRENLRQIVSQAARTNTDVFLMNSPVRPEIPMILNSKIIQTVDSRGRINEKLLCQYDLDGFWLMDAETFPGTEMELDQLLKTYPDLPILHYYKAIFLESRSDYSAAEYEMEQTRQLDVEREVVNLYNQYILEVTKTTPAKLIDLIPEFQLLGKKAKLFLDDCHPNSNGHDIITHKIVDSLFADNSKTDP